MAILTIRKKASVMIKAMILCFICFSGASGLYAQYESSKKDTAVLLPEQRKYMLSVDGNYGLNTIGLSGFFQYYFFRNVNTGGFLFLSNDGWTLPKQPFLDTVYSFRIEPMASIGYTFFHKWFSFDISYLAGLEFTFIKERLQIPKYNIDRTYTTSEILYDSALQFSIRMFIYNKAALNLRFLSSLPDIRKSLVGVGVTIPFGEKRVY